MNCPLCAKELKLEGDFYHSDVDLEGNNAAVGSVTITFICADCGGDLGEYDFDLEQDITDFSVGHDDEEEHELSVELDDESYDEHVDNNSVVYPGATATVKLSCMCGKSVEYQWSDYEEQATIIKALFS